jgi:hypothetical protein
MTRKSQISSISSLFVVQLFLGLEFLFDFVLGRRGGRGAFVAVLKTVVVGTEKIGFALAQISSII